MIPAPSTGRHWTASREWQELLRFLTCGSVDDGKSTLIGRMLKDCGALAADRLEGVTDLSLLADGLEAEREQGITIDVAYLYFATPKRRFILADTPGHEQYTRNMATGASNADLALVLVDARKGLLTQTRRHSRIARLLGIRSFILAVNKMDLVGFDRAVFETIAAAFRGVRGSDRDRAGGRDPGFGARRRQCRRRGRTGRPGMTGRPCSPASRRRRPPGPRPSPSACRSRT